MPSLETAGTFLQEHGEAAAGFLFKTLKYHRYSRKPPPFRCDRCKLMLNPNPQARDD
jgi:hypothetical protein